MATETKLLKANQIEKNDVITEIGSFVYKLGWLSEGLVVRDVRHTPDGINHITTANGAILALSGDWDVKVQREVKPMARFYFKNNPSVVHEVVGPESQLYQNASVIVEEGTGRVIKAK